MAMNRAPSLPLTAPPWSATISTEWAFPSCQMVFVTHMLRQYSTERPCSTRELTSPVVWPRGGEGICCHEVNLLVYKGVVRCIYIQLSGTNHTIRCVKFQSARNLFVSLRMSRGARTGMCRPKGESVLLYCTHDGTSRWDSSNVPGI
jgi:hypothetical protein